MDSPINTDGSARVTLASALGNNAMDNNRFWQALQDLKRFFAFTPASASNDNRYRQALMDAGLSDADTGIGH